MRTRQIIESERECFDGQCLLLHKNTPKLVQMEVAKVKCVSAATAILFSSSHHPAFRFMLNYSGHMEEIFN